MKRLTIVTAALLTIPAIAYAVPSPKYFVCKYVGTPGTNETLQTGQNPISVSVNALTPPIVIGGSFNDKQGRSYVIAEDTGQPEPTCPAGQTPPPTPTPTPVTPPPTVTPPVVSQNQDSDTQTTSSITNDTPNMTGFVGK